MTCGNSCSLFYLVQKIEVIMFKKFRYIDNKSLTPMKSLLDTSLPPLMATTPQYV